MALVVFTSLCGCLLSPFPIHGLSAALGILSITLASGAAGCLNQWYEAKSDARMERTKNRPVAAGRITPLAGLTFGLLIAFLSLCIMQLTFGFFQSFFLFFNIIFYSFFYTVVLKPNTDQNIVIGGGAGALPPVIGYSFCGTVDLYAWVLFLIIFMWTPTHFWALSLRLKDDYKSANIPILPNTKGNLYTKKMMGVYAILTTMCSFIPLFLRHSMGLMWFIFIVLNTIWLHLSYAVYKDQKDPIKLFLFSILYLFLIFFSLIIFHRL
ncbi:MAG: Protoheme IX farnesyltransferase [Holosporales bacterium]